MTCPCHICAFYHDIEELYDVLLPFLKEGLDIGDRVVSVVSPSGVADQFDRLGNCGVDVGTARLNGQLNIESWDNAYLRGGQFDLEEMIGFAQESITTGMQLGFTRTRGWANMSWALTGAPARTAWRSTRAA